MPQPMPQPQPASTDQPRATAEKRRLGRLQHLVAPKRGQMRGQMRPPLQVVFLKKKRPRSGHSAFCFCRGGGNGCFWGLTFGSTTFGNTPFGKFGRARRRKIVTKRGVFEPLCLFFLLCDRSRFPRREKHYKTWRFATSHNIEVFPIGQKVFFLVPRPAASPKKPGLREGPKTRTF